MIYHQLGNTDLTVSEICFGGWGIGGYVNGFLSYGHKDDRISTNTLKTAYELGVNIFDTSCSYGCGHSEKLIGETFENDRDSVLYATKAGYLPKYNPAGPNQSFNRDDIVKSLCDSMKRLKTDYIDIFQLHDCRITEIERNQELFDMLIQLKKRGAIRAIGFAGKIPEETVKALDIFPFDVIQCGFSLVDGRILDSGLLEKCRDRNIGVIARTPLAFGFITDKRRDNLQPDDHRIRFSEEQRKEWAAAKDRYKDAYSEHNYSWAQKAILYPLSTQGVHTVNVGMNESIQALENIRASKLKRLSANHLIEIERVYHQYYRDTKL